VNAPAKLALPVSRRGDVVLVVLLLVLSGNPGIYSVLGGEEVVLTLATVVLAALVMSRRSTLVPPRVLWVGGALVAILVLQSFAFGFLPIVTILGLVTRLFVGAAVVTLVIDFPSTYVRAMVAIAIYALVMYGLDQVSLAAGLGFRDLFAPLERWVGMDADHRYALVYTFTVLDGTYRNAAFFSEPGLFAGYLLLALLFLMFRTHAFERRLVIRYVAILVVALASTFSTAGYVTLPIVLAAIGLRYADRLDGVPRRWGLASVFVLGCGAVWIVSESSSFLEDKIVSQYESFIEEGQGYEITRFGAALMDVQALEERPLFGWGLHESTKYELTPELAELSPSGGVTGWARSFGLVGLAILVAALWRGSRELSRHPIARGYAVFAMLLIAQPNTFLNYPLFIGLLFLGANDD
jgi:hypothetical protein